jgi:hypothetical protein
VTDSIDKEDRERVRGDYAGNSRTRESVQSRLEDADFEQSSAQAFADEIAGANDMPVSNDALRSASQQALSQLKDGGAIGGQVLQGKDLETGRNKSIGKPSNVTQEIERTGRTSGDVIGVNENTGTRAKIGEVELAPPVES